jgi:glycosyltransferase involved in cell wall biosynthesis
MKNFDYKQLKIAIIEPIGAYGGMEIYDLSILEGLSKYSDCVHLYTSTYFSQLSDVSFDKIKMVFGRIYSKDKSTFIRLLMLFRGLIRLLKSLLINRYEIIYCHVFTYSFLELMLVLIARLGGGRVFINIHDPEPFVDKSNAIIKKIFKIIFRDPNCKVVTHSLYSKNILMRNFSGILPVIMPHTDVDYIYTPTACSELQSKKLLELNTEDKYVLFFGQIKRNKGLDILIKAYSESEISIKGYKLLIAGRCWGEEWANYQKIIEENLLSDDVVVVNSFIEPQMVYHYFNVAQYVLLPYTEIFSSGVLIRASGYGKPVICSDLPAFMEEIVDKENGIIFQAGNVQSLASALCSATFSVQTAELMSRKVIEKYSKKYDRFIVAREMLKVFGA